MHTFWRAILNNKDAESTEVLLVYQLQSDQLGMHDAHYLGTVFVLTVASDG